MITDILITAVEVCAFFGGIYFLVIYLWTDSERKKQEKVCPHCKVPANRNSPLYSRLKQVSFSLKQQA